MKKLLKLDWEVIAGLIAAVAALILHFLHVVETDVLLNVAVVLIALLFLRDLRRERQSDRIEATLQRAALATEEIRLNQKPTEVTLVGPRQLREVTEQFSVQSRGEMVWFHVCLTMFSPQPLFDCLLRPAIENPQVTSLQFVLDEEQHNLWNNEVIPKINRCSGRHKVKEPRWTRITENISIIVSDVRSESNSECLLSFWGEPFMARSSVQDIPRYIFHVKPKSELVGRLIDLIRSYSIGVDSVGKDVPGRD
jgi:hypothetical protein